MKKNDTYKRKLSLNERTWIAVAQAYPPFCNQMILEGDTHSVIDKTKLETAVEKASAANPGSRVTLKGFWRTCQLVDSGKSPRVREVDGSKWSGFDDKGAPFFADPLSPDLKEPACEVLIIHGSPLRLAFRSHHAIMDARGTFVWVEDIFRALHGESPIGSDSTLNDLDLGLKYKKKEAQSPISGYLSPLGSAQGNEDGFCWIRKQLSGRYRYLIAQIALLLAREAWSISKGKVLFCIPVDWRLLHQDIRTTANLSTAVTLEATTETTHKEFTDDLKILVMQQSRPYSAFNTVLPFIPFWLIRSVLTKFTKKTHKKGYYPFSAVLTGARERDFDLRNLSGEGFNCNDVFFIPPYLGSTPFFLAFVEYGNVIQLVATAPKVMATSGRFDAIMNTIVSGLVPADK
jgi:hypothetical protein